MSTKEFDQKAMMLVEKLRRKVKNKDKIEKWLIEVIVVNYLHEDLEKAKITQEFFVAAVRSLKLSDDQKEKICHQKRTEEEMKQYALNEIKKNTEQFGGDLEENEETSMIMTSYRYECGNLYRDEFVKIARYFNYELDIDAIDKYFREEVPFKGVGMYHSIPEHFKKINKGEK